MYATIDIETTGLNRYKDKITWIGIGLSKSIEDDFFRLYLINVQTKAGKQKAMRVLKKLREQKCKTVLQNGKFDTLFIEEKTGLRIPISEDIMLMGTAYDLVAQHGLKKMAQEYLGVPDWDISKKEKLSGGDTVKPYLRLDVVYTWKLFQYFMRHMNEQQMKVYRKLLRPAMLMYRDVERNGAYLVLDDLRAVRAKYDKQEAEKLAELNSRYDINWNSSGQVANVLFSDDKENLPVIKKSGKTGKPSFTVAGTDKACSRPGTVF